MMPCMCWIAQHAGNSLLACTMFDSNTILDRATMQVLGLTLSVMQCREDLRHLPICSVDPPGCKDIDDALHVQELPNGNIELGVHIADVTNFLLPATAMDDEASIR